MNVKILKGKILSNTFVDTVRGEMRFDEDTYLELKADLEALAMELRGSETLDRELALTLYSIPLMVRNAFLSFAEHPAPRAAIASQLEAAWTELDSLITECLSE